MRRTRLGYDITDGRNSFGQRSRFKGVRGRQIPGGGVALRGNHIGNKRANIYFERDGKRTSLPEGWVRGWI